MRGIAVVVILACASVVHGQPTDPKAKAEELAALARRRIQDGGGFASAVDLFVRAYELTKEPPYLINAGVAARKGGLPHFAVLAYRRCLAECGAALADDTRQQLASDIETITGESARVIVRTAGGPATITLDEREVGLASKGSPLTVLVMTEASKRHRLTATRPGFETKLHTLDPLHAGEEIAVEIEPIAKLGHVNITSVPAGARIAVKSVTGVIASGTAPYAADLIPGSYELSAQLPGYDIAYQTLAVDIGRTHDVTLRPRRIEGSWWRSHRFKVVIGGAIVLSAGAAFGAYKLFEPDYGRVIRHP